MIDPRQTPTPAEFEKLGFKNICSPHPDCEWFEIENQDQADFACRATETAVHIFYKAEADANPGRPPPHRWFILLGNRKDVIHGEVVMAAPGPGLGMEGAVPRAQPLHITGYRNKNAFPEWANEIQILSDTTGIPMPPNYMGRDIEPEEAAPPSP